MEDKNRASIQQQKPFKKSSLQKNKVVAAFLGTIIEYYDYSLYGFSAGILASKFFIKTDKLTSLLYSFAVYSLAYFSKPFGALFFSKIGDKYGRKISLRLSLLGIAFPTLIIGLLPEYKMIGILSTILLILCRICQGFFIAGEYDGAAIYVIEHLGNKFHYTASALTRAAGVIGLLLGILAVNSFNSSLFTFSWNWRIPFLLSVPFALITIYYRRYLEETPDYKESIKKNKKILGILDFVKKQWRNLLKVILLAGGFGVTYQGSIVFMKQFLPIVFPEFKNIMPSFSLLIVLSFGIAMPFSGLLADYFNRNVVIRFSLYLTFISIILLIFGINYKIINLTLISVIMLAISVAPFNALAHGIIIKVFPVTERYKGISFGHTVGSMLMSGTANYIFIAGMKFFNFNYFPILYITLFSIVAFFMIENLNKTN
ncbi:MAG: MHS family MFS transporter [Bacteroidetes bacterium]|nr:MHS family MFS transporter [Bacteroidota bacterium]